MHEIDSTVTHGPYNCLKVGIARQEDKLRPVRQKIEPIL